MKRKESIQNRKHRYKDFHNIMVSGSIKNIKGIQIILFKMSF